jgi:hypothetical protein
MKISALQFKSLPGPTAVRQYSHLSALATQVVVEGADLSGAVLSPGSGLAGTGRAAGERGGTQTGQFRHCPEILEKKCAAQFWTLGMGAEYGEENGRSF